MHTSYEAEILRNEWKAIRCDGCSINTKKKEHARRGQDLPDYVLGVPRLRAGAWLRVTMIEGKERSRAQ